MIGVSGRSGSGKTLLIESLVPRLRGRGLRVAVVKHCSHHIEADTPGKDSDRIFKAGADVLAAGPREAFARFHECELDPRQAAHRVAAGCDLCIVEGYKDYGMPRIQIIVEGYEHYGMPRVQVVDHEAGPPGAEADDVLLAVRDVEEQLGDVETALLKALERSHRALPLMGLMLTGSRGAGMMGGNSPSGDDRGAMESTVAALGMHAQSVFVAGSGPVPAPLARLGRLIDAPSARGPLAAILSAMHWHPAARWVVATCGAPALTKSALEWLVSQGGVGIDAVLPRIGGESPEAPALALYEPTCLVWLERAALKGVAPIREALAGARVAEPPLP
jgi:molybdopterin-guanine dinucleotide biosynthesis protein MobB